MQQNGGEVKRRRRYESPLRRQQASQTLDRIVGAAHRLFIERGYAQTTIQDVAREAGVAERTVYATVKNKRALLFVVIDAAIAGDTGPQSLAERAEFGAVLDEPDPPRQLVLFASLVRGIHERTSALVRVLQAAAAVDAEMAELWAAHAEGQVDDEARVIRSLEGKRALRSGLGTDEALDTLWALTTPQFFAQVHDHGWSADHYERWLADALQRLLLA
jgi:AcrR family transcriptional regulator